MKNKVLDFSVMKEEISQNNVLEMAELIAFMELRFQIGYLGSRAQKMYSDLYQAETDFLLHIRFYKR